MLNTVYLCPVCRQLFKKTKSCKCYIATVIPIIRLQLLIKMTVKSIHSKVHVQLATRPDNITNMRNESQSFTVIFDNSKVLLCLFPADNAVL